MAMSLHYFKKININIVVCTIEILMVKPSCMMCGLAAHLS